MEWIRSHPHASALAAAGILVVLGGMLVINRSPAPSPSGISAWTGNTAAFGTTTNAAAQAASSQTGPSAFAAENYGTRTLPYTQNTPPVDSQGVIQTNGGDSYDFNALMAELSNPSLKAGAAAASTTGPTVVNAWSFIPTGLISIQNVSSSGRTPLQQSLYRYGNEVGSLIEGYDAAHGDQAQVLSGANNDRQNAAKQAAVEKIGEDLETVGQGIAEITDAPDAAQADNAALSKSYIDIGTKLVAVGAAEPLQDSALVSAIESYDSAVNSFNGAYIALANLFSAYGVTFSSGDPGSVFSFSPSAL
jgi:hypothetical protein